MRTYLCDAKQLNRIIFENRKKRKKCILQRLEQKCGKLTRFLSSLSSSTSIHDIKTRPTNKVKLNKKDICSICCESLKSKKDLCHTPCQHTFHYKCYDSLVCGFAGNYWHKCPNCRTDLFDCIMKISKYSSKYDKLDN